MSVKFSGQDENIVFEEEINEISKEEENRISELCSNVINCMVIVQNSQSDLSEFKSLLLKENIAPSVLVKLSLINGKLFRSISDMYNPLSELIRLVRVYSEPWEKKSEALRKLHVDYEKKSAQLDLALRALARQNEDMKRVTKKETLQNWEFLFTRAQVHRNHGRRWKYKMFEFKMKAQEGINNLHDYFQILLDEDDGIKEKSIFVAREPQMYDSRSKTQRNESSRTNYEDLFTKELEDNKSTENEEYQESVEEKVETESIEPIETVDVSVGTSDLNFSQTLVMKIYNPNGIEHFENLRARIIYGDMIYHTNNLDKTKELEIEDKRIEKELSGNLTTVAVESKSKLGLIGRRKNKQVKPLEKSVDQIRKEQLDKRLRYLEKHEEIRIPIPNDVVSGINQNNLYRSIKIILLTNDKSEKKIAHATIDWDEIKDLDLKIFKEYNFRGDMVTPPPLSDEKPFSNLEPMMFPLYEYVENINSESSPTQLGQLPISCFYSRKERQILFHRSTETEPINRLIEELTGVNLDAISKNELQQEKVDESLSPRSETPKPATVLKSEFDAISNKFEEKLNSIREYYENKISEISENNVKLSEKEPVRPPTVYHKDCAVSPIFPYRHVPGNRRLEKRETREVDNVNENRFSSKSRETLSTSGPDNQNENLYAAFDLHEKTNSANTSVFKINLPESFLERVSFFSEKSYKYKEDLANRIKTEISKAIEDKLAELYKLNSDLTEEDVSLALSDMCLPAMFMPFTNSTGTIYNPRAHQYFHPIGLKNFRLSQAPSIFKLPPIKNNQLSVLNLFEMGNHMQIKHYENDFNNHMNKKALNASESEKIFSVDN